jgi:ketosteroid isomerase-like protein
VVGNNKELVRGIYEAFGKGDVPTVLAGLDANVEWKEAEGFPTAGTYTGHDAVVQGVFMPLVTEWEGFAVKPEALVGEGDSVVSYGTYSGACKATGKSMSARFAHVWKVRDGKVVSFEQIVDSVPVQAAMK